VSTLRRRELLAALVLYLGVFTAVSIALLMKHMPGDGSDYWTHLAAIRALAEGRSPADLPLRPGPDMLERHYDPSHLAWAIVLRHSGLSGTDVMALAGIVHVAVFLCGLAFLASRLGPPALTASCFLVVMLFLWGTGFGWSNEYYLAVLPKVGPYPSMLAWGLSLFALGLVETWSRRGGALRLAGAMLLGALTVAVHPLTALMFGISFPVLWVWLARTSWSRRWAALLLPGAALALSLAWGHATFLTQLRMVLENPLVRLGQPSQGALGSPVSPQTLLALGPLPVAVVFLAWVPRRRRRQLAAGIGLYALAWLGGTLLGVPLAYRFIFFLAFVLHMTAGLALAFGWRLWRRRRRLAASRRWSPARVPAAVLATALLLAPCAPLQAYRLAGMAAGRLDVRALCLRPSPLVQLEDSCARLRAEMGRGRMVLSDSVAGRHLAAFGLPVVPPRWLPEEPPEELTPMFVRHAANSARAAGASYLLFRRAELTGQEKRILARQGAVRRMPPDVVLVQLRAKE
jgi:hypothetical protein